MNLLKKGVAVLLCMAMCIPSVLVSADDSPSTYQSDAGLPEAVGDVVRFNTGSYERCAVDETKMQELKMDDTVDLSRYVAYNADGRCEIQVEEDAFFPYEVQFTYDGETSSKWFMTSEDTIQVGGHEFYLYAPVTGDVVTQMKMNIGGDIVTVYPEEKEFTDDPASLVQPTSLLPLKERKLSVNFNDYTPVELTKVTFASVFQGEQELPKGTSVMWRRSYSDTADDYTVGSFGDCFDMFGYSLEIIVGEKDQLAADNIRYFISSSSYYTGNWLTSAVCLGDESKQAVDSDCSYSHYYKDYKGDIRNSSIRVYIKDSEKPGDYLVSLKLNSRIYPQPKYAQMKVFTGKLTEAELQAAPDITSQIWESDISAGGGYRMTLTEKSVTAWITFATYDENGNITGCMPAELELRKKFKGVSPGKFYTTASNGKEVQFYSYSQSVDSDDGVIKYSYNLKYPSGDYIYGETYPADGQYTQRFDYYNGEESTDNTSSDIKAAYIGKWDSIDDAQKVGAADIKADLFSSGYTADYSKGVTFSIFIASGDEQEMQKYYYRMETEAEEAGTGTWISVRRLVHPDTGESVSYESNYSYADAGVIEYTHSLEEPYPLDGQYRQKLYFYRNGKQESPGADVTAYVGKYGSVNEAQNAGAENVKEVLFGDGYTADYSKGVTFSVFIGPDGETQQKYCYLIKTERYLNDEASVSFTGLVMKGENETDSIKVPSYIIGRGSHDFDSYGDGNFYTFYVDKKAGKQAVDLHSLALTFNPAKGAKLYAEGTDTQEVSGESFHDFSDTSKAMQFTVTSQDGKNQKNYFIRVVQLQTEQDASPAKLYVNSLDDTAAKTYEENGIIYSTREVFLDSYHKNRHDILVSNIGYTTMSALRVVPELEDMVLDDYWTLTGSSGLSGFVNMRSNDEDRSHGQLSNLALVRLKARSGLESSNAKDYGELGKLTFMSGETPVMVLTLTGIVGDPRIITTELRNPTKYVPYGTMIMNNNKYDWNKVRYIIASGRLPEGMSLTPSGELYGVPKEAGDFEFTVTLDNVYPLKDDTKTFKFTVLDNTDSNVDQAEDTGYKLTKRISGIGDTTATGDYLIISEGIFDEYTDLFIDGEKLEKGTDYDAESGSTRITIAAQSLPKSEGTHTIGVEFRQEKSAGRVKVAAQNYRVAPKSSSNSSSSSSSSSGSWGGGSSSGGSRRPAGNTNKPDNSTSPDPGGSSGNSGSQPAPQPVPQPAPDHESDQPIDTSISKTMVYARNYTVKEGDTLKSLAKKFYGKSSKWKKIYNANKKKIPASKKLKKGMKLTIPAVSYTVKKGDTIKSIAKKYFGANSKWKLIYQINQDVIPSSLKLKAGEKLVLPVPVVCRIYTVKKGDTLKKIARKFYGKTSKWEKIYHANKNKVSASQKVKAGTSLFIPAMTCTVKKGDDMKSIAKKYYGAKSEWRQIYDANRDIVPASKKLKAGITLVLPVPVDIA